MESLPPSRTPRVCALYIYPVKGARGIPVERSDVLRAGLRNDRRFMVVDARGRFLTQREHPRMAQIETAIEGEMLSIAVGSDRARVRLDVEGPARTVTVWKDEVAAVETSAEAGRLLSAHLGLACSLVRMPASTFRGVERAHARDGDHLGFADAFPVLIASLASLADLNARLEAPVGIDRFRANVIVSGIEPWAEEAAARIRVGDVSFRTPKKCSRCVIITTDQRTGVVTGKEPLRTLAIYRREGNSANFAMNAIPDLVDVGRVAIGDPVVLE